jgi:hypothetical protein
VKKRMWGNIKQLKHKKAIKLARQMLLSLQLFGIYAQQGGDAGQGPGFLCDRSGGHHWVATQGQEGHAGGGIDVAPDKGKEAEGSV